MRKRQSQVQAEAVFIVLPGAQGLFVTKIMFTDCPPRYGAFVRGGQQ